VSVSIAALELARGHDGLLRGKPEPVVVIGALLCDEVESRVVGRARVAFAVSGDYPVVSAAPRGASLGLRARVRERARVVVVAMALEEDAGDGVAAAYAALGEPGAISAWFEGASVPEPRGLVELAAEAGASPMAGPARLLLAGADVGDLVTGDDWVGACVAVVDVAGASPGERVRLRFVDREARNDWTAVVDVRAS
jgi:hypothetical protein